MRETTEEQLKVAKSIAKKLKNIDAIAKKSGLVVMACGDGGGSFSIFLEEDYQNSTNCDTVYGLKNEDGETVESIIEVSIPQFKY